MHKWIVYKHTNILNGKIYIGITGQGAERRWRSGGKGYKKCIAFYRAIEKYGWDNFSHEILFEGLDKGSAERLEQELIRDYRSNDSHYGYNIANGGKVGSVSEITKKRISETLKRNYKKENHPNYGKHYDDAFRKKLSIAHKGINAGEQSPNYGKHMCDTQRKRIRDTMMRRGISPSDEARRKAAIVKHEKGNSELWRRRIKEAKSLPVVQFSLNGDALKTYSSITEAVQDLGKNISGGSNITAVCKGRKKTAYGYIWKYAGE